MCARPPGLTAAALLLVALVCAPGDRSASAACIGDCDLSGRVTVDELIHGVNIVQGSASLTECATLDVDASGGASINELVSAVNRALDGCPPEPQPTPTATIIAPSPTPELWVMPLRGPDAPSELLRIGRSVFFKAKVEPWLSDAPIGLWRTDGTQDGTVMLLSNIGQSNGGSLAERNGTLFFLVNLTELWKSDGTPEGTLRVKAVDSEFCFNCALSGLMNVAGTLFFGDTDGFITHRLWKSDGTEAGTLLIKDFGGSTLVFLYSFTAVGNTLMFVANDGITGEELWKSDGTSDGTVLVRDIRPGEEGSSPNSLIDVNGVLFFIADDGTTGPELWRSDGTAEGTLLVRDITPGLSEFSFKTFLASHGGTLFFAADDGIHGYELWKSDGTPGGTMLVADLAPGLDSSNPYAGAVLGDLLYFEALRGLWKSDGTPEGTTLVRKVEAASLRVLDERLIFEGMDPAQGGSVWASDGSTSGTYPVIDTPNLCTESSNARGFVDLGSRLLFVAAGKLYSADKRVLSTPTTTTCLPKPRHDRIDVQVFISETNKVYVVISPNIKAVGGQAIQVTSLAISHDDVRSVNERVAGPDSVLTSVAGAIGRTIPVHRLKRTAIVSGIFVASPPDIAFDLTGDGAMRFGFIFTFILAWNAGAGGDFSPACSQATTRCIVLCDSGAFDPGRCGIVPAAVVSTVERASASSSIMLNALVFPNGVGPLSPLTFSDGARCSTTQLPCDPADPAPRSCFGGRCDLLGGERGAQNVTLDDTVGSIVGSPSQGDGRLIDGFRLGFSDVIIFAFDAGNDRRPVQAAASGFVLDEDGRVLDAVGP